MHKLLWITNCSPPFYRACAKGPTQYVTHTICVQGLGTSYNSTLPAASTRTHIHDVNVGCLSFVCSCML